MLKDFGIVTPSDYVGLTIDEAKRVATEKGFTTRLVELDGKGLIVTEDLKSNRINLRVKDNYVTDVFPG